MENADEVSRLPDAGMKNFYLCYHLCGPRSLELISVCAM